MAITEKIKNYELKIKKWGRFWTLLRIKLRKGRRAWLARMTKRRGDPVCPARESSSG